MLENDYLLIFKDRKCILFYFLWCRIILYQNEQQSFRGWLGESKWACLFKCFNDSYKLI